MNGTLVSFINVISAYWLILRLCVCTCACFCVCECEQKPSKADPLNTCHSVKGAEACTLATPTLSLHAVQFQLAHDDVWRKESTGNVAGRSCRRQARWQLSSDVCGKCHSFIPQIFIKYLLCDNHCPRPWWSSTKQGKIVALTRFIFWAVRDR